MGSENSPISKPHYNITMSKRTRKPLNLNKEAEPSPLEAFSLEKESDLQKDVKEVEEKSAKEGEESNDHKSLKQLMITGEGSKGRSSLGQHFTEEEKHLQVVVKQHEESLDGVKFKRMVSRYAKVLSHLIKIKGQRDPRLGSQKKPVFRFTV